MEEKRKGARSVKDVPKNVLQQLNCGQIESANLVEWLAIDQLVLLKNLLQATNRTIYLKAILAKVATLKKQTVNTINEAIGNSIYLQTQQAGDAAFFTIIASHKADAVRCWAAYVVSSNKQLTLKETLQQIEPFAADTHFGVREISWLATRPTIAKNLLESIQLLKKWAKHTNDNIRRFASEATRPRGVWCAHIDILKQKPELGLPILELLKCDKSKYVQDSVGNWLNDASKTAPQFVIDICTKWEKESETPETMYIIKKAMRTIGKNL
jgi:3-methyladenine DNA glycosylase AlkC